MALTEESASCSDAESAPRRSSVVHSSITTLTLVMAKPAPRPAAGHTAKATAPGTVRIATSAMPTPATASSTSPSATSAARFGFGSRLWIAEAVAQLSADSISGVPARVGE